MVPEIVNSQRFCKAICQHIGTANLLNFNLSVGYQLANIIVLNVDMLGAGLFLSFFCQNNTCFIVSVEDTGVNRFCKA